MVFVGKYFFEKHYHISATSNILTLNSFEVKRYHGVYDMQSYILNQKSKWRNTSSTKSNKSKHAKSNLKSNKLVKSSKVENTITATDFTQPKNLKTSVQYKENKENVLSHDDIENDVEKPYNEKSPSNIPNNNFDISLESVNSVNSVNNVNKIKKQQESSQSQTSDNEIVESNGISISNKIEKHHKLKDNCNQNNLPICIHYL